MHRKNVRSANCNFISKWVAYFSFVRCFIRMLYRFAAAISTVIPICRLFLLVCRNYTAFSLVFLLDFLIFNDAVFTHQLRCCKFALEFDKIWLLNAKFIDFCYCIFFILVGAVPLRLVVALHSPVVVFGENRLYLVDGETFVNFWILNFDQLPLSFVNFLW